MITPEEIKSKTGKKYLSFLSSWMEGKPFEKLVIRGDKTYAKASLSEFEKEILLLISQSRVKKGYGYTLDFQQVKTKYLGTQDLPTTIYFDTEQDLLRYLGKEKEVVQFRENLEKIISTFPGLKEWTIQNPYKIIQHPAEWDNLLKVCQYFKQNPTPNLYLRELPVQVHTKFIERHQSILAELLDKLIPEHINHQEKVFEKRFNLKMSEKLVRFKILDKEISRVFFSSLDDISIPVSQFEKLKLPIEKVIIVENKTTLYTTLTLPKMDKAIAIFGSGYSVSQLKRAVWLKNIELLYWGDIDVQGFEILSQFRSYFPQTKSILMDKATFDLYFEDDIGTPSHISVQLNLTAAEQELYTLLRANQWRLEQEKIPLGYVNDWLGNQEA